MIFNRSLKCPCCGSDLQHKDLNFTKPFCCPHCKRELKVSRFYSTFFGLLAFAISFLIMSKIGLQDFSLLAASFIGWLPVASIESLMLQRLFPPKPIPVDDSLI